MNQTTYYGLLNDNGVFDSKVNSVLWQNIISIIPTNEIESFVVICNLDKEFYPERKKCLKRGKIFSSNASKYHLKFNHSEDKEIGYELFDCKEEFTYQWIVNRRIFSPSNNCNLIFDTVENINSGEIFFQLKMIGFSKKWSELLNEMFSNHRDNSNNSC